MINEINGPNPDFAIRLLNARKRENKTQEQVATHCGIASRNISLYESGHAMPRPTTLQKIADFLGTDAYFLVHGRDKLTDQYLSQSCKKDFFHKKVNYLYVNDWDVVKLRTNFNRSVPQYNENPTRQNQSNDLSKFIPYLSDPFHYIAVRLPEKLTNFCSSNPNNFDEIAIINTAHTSTTDLKNGTYILYAPIDMTQQPSLGIIKREIGEQNFFIASVPNELKVTAYNDTEYQILGEVEAILINKI